MDGDVKSINFLPLKHLSFQNHWVAKRLGAEAPYPSSGTVEVTLRGGARGELGVYSPLSEHASPPSEGEKRFFRRFLAFIVP